MEANEPQNKPSPVPTNLIYVLSLPQFQALLHGVITLTENLKLVHDYENALDIEQKKTAHSAIALGMSMTIALNQHKPQVIMEIKTPQVPSDIDPKNN